MTEYQAEQSALAEYQQSNCIARILNFFDEIGLPHQYTMLHGKTFLPGMKIDNGTLLIDPDKIEHPGDLLHEAGHIAVTPRGMRNGLVGDMKGAGHKGGDEMAAIAWSWAALKHICLPPEVVFHREGYRGGSQCLIRAFTSGGGFGHPLLYAWSMCQQPEQPEGFPKMIRWFREE